MTRLQHIDFEILLVPAKRDPGREIDPRLEDGDLEARRHHDVLGGVRVEERSVIRTQRVGHRCRGGEGGYREDWRKSQHRS